MTAGSATLKLDRRKVWIDWILRNEEVPGNYKSGSQ